MSIDKISASVEGRAASLLGRIHDAAMKDFATAYTRFDTEPFAFGIGSGEDIPGMPEDVHFYVYARRKWATIDRTSWSFEHFIDGEKVTGRAFLRALEARLAEGGS
jgi:hypothetical protein